MLYLLVAPILQRILLGSMFRGYLLYRLPPIRRAWPFLWL